MLQAERDGGRQAAAGLGCADRTSATAATISWPPNQHCSTAPRRPAHDRSTGAPALTTTTVRWLTAATRRISSSCRPGSSKCLRSRPSVSHSCGRADEHDRHVGGRRRGDRPRRAARRCPRVRKPTRKPASAASDPGVLDDELDRRPRSSGRLAARGPGWPARRSRVPPGGGGLVNPSRTSSPSTRQPGPAALRQGQLERPALLGRRRCPGRAWTSRPREPSCAGGSKHEQPELVEVPAPDARRRTRARRRPRTRSPRAPAARSARPGVADRSTSHPRS